MNQAMIAAVVEVTLLIIAIAGFVGVLAAGGYDMLAIARRPRLQERMRKLHKPRQPAVTILIYTRNDEDTIGHCLQAVRQGSYRNYDVVVIDNVSSDGTRRAVRAFMKRYPNVTLRLYAKRKPVSVGAALEQGYRRSQKGEIIMTLSGASFPSRDLLKAAVARFEDDARLRAVTMNERFSAPLTLGMILPVLGHLGWHTATKILNITGRRRGYLALNGVYRRPLQRADRMKVRYDGGLVLPVTRLVANEPFSGSSGPALSTGKFFLGLMALFLMTYSMVMAALLMSSMPLIMEWLLVTIGSLAIIWSDEALGMVQKIEQTTAVPFVYFLIYAKLVEYMLKTGVNWLVFLLKARPKHYFLHLGRRAIS